MFYLHPISQRQSVNFQRRIKEMVTIYREFLILFDMEDEHYDGLDTALLEALVKAQVSSSTFQNYTGVSVEL